MKFTLVILGAPYSTQAPVSALKFAKAVLSTGNDLFRVFFYEDAVHTASLFSCPPQDEINIRVEWEQLRTKNNIDLVVCIAAALKRGLLDEREAQRFEIEKAGNLSPAFELSGLGQLVEATELSDHVITFY